MITEVDIDITKLQWQVADKCYTYTYPNNKVATIQEYKQNLYNKYHETHRLL